MSPRQPIRTLESSMGRGGNPLRLALITLEFSCGTFSGNGILCQSQVRALSALGHKVIVLCARPAVVVDEARCAGATELIEIPVSSWGRLDVNGPWREFAQGAQSQEIISSIAAFDADVVIGVDWSSLLVYETLKEGLDQGGWKVPQYVYTAFRIFSRLENGAVNNIMERMEVECMQQAASIIALCKSDQEYMQQNLIRSLQVPKKPIVLLPPLRSDIARFAPPSDMHNRNSSFSRLRPYFTCCVRLSKEKEPERFLQVVSEMSQRNVLGRFNLVPVLCSSTATPYAKGLRQQLKQSVPECIIQHEYRNSTQMVDLFRKTRINFHPCAYDSYGMTIVEAASQGAPSIIDAAGNVGATDLLDVDMAEHIALDFSKGVSAIVDKIVSCLDNAEKLNEIGKAACIKVRSYTEEANAQALVDCLSGLI